MKQKADRDLESRAVQIFSFAPSKDRHYCATVIEPNGDIMVGFQRITVINILIYQIYPPAFEFRLVLSNFLDQICSANTRFFEGDGFNGQDKHRKKCLSFTNLFERDSGVKLSRSISLQN